MCVRERGTLTLRGEQLGSVNMLSSVPSKEVPAPIVLFIHRPSGTFGFVQVESGGCLYSQQTVVFVCISLLPLICFAFFYIKGIAGTNKAQGQALCVEIDVCALWIGAPNLHCFIH